MRRGSFIGSLALLAILPIRGVAQEAVVFRKRAAQPGDTARQLLTCDLELVLSIRQGGQIIQEQNQELVRKQSRELTVLQVEPGGPRRAKVTYRESEVSLKSAGAEPQASQQPVTGKTYLVTRQGDDLEISYPDGSAPPPEELAIVTDNMATFGMPNPIAEFFNGKTIRVGDKLELPAALARELLGFAETANSVSDFRMRLASIRRAQGNQPASAVFELMLVAEDPQQSGISMKLQGQHVIEIDSCRTLAVNLSGPVAASETHGPDAASYEVHTQGDIQIAVQAIYLRR